MDNANLHQFEHFQPLLDTIYEATLDPSQWHVFFKDLLALTGSTSGSIMAHYFNDLKGIAQITCVEGIDEKFSEDYNNYYVQVDPFRPLMINAPEGEVMLSHEYIPDKLFLKSEFYQDFFSQFGSRYTVTQFIRRTPEMTFLIGLSRGDGMQPYENEIKNLLQALQPHINRAICITQKISTADKEITIRNSLLDTLNVGILIVDRYGKILSFNQKAETSISNNKFLAIKNGKLATALVDENQLLAQTLKQACKGRKRYSGSMQLSNEIGKPPLQLSVNPVNLPNSETGLDIPGATAIVILIEPETNPSETLSIILENEFNLTNAEKRLAMELVNGLTLVEIADKYKVSRNTLKTQCKSLYRKTGVNNQTSLVNLILTSAKLALYKQ